MEAYSVEDKGRGLAFNVFVFNIQPGIVIDGRYQFKHDCRTYREFQDRNAMSPEQLKKLTPDEQAMQAAKCLPPQP